MQDIFHIWRKSLHINKRKSLLLKSGAGILVAMNTEIRMCLNPNHQKAAFARGLCPACYASASRLVRAKKITWEQLEKEGKAKSPAKEYGNTEGWLLSK